MLSLSQDQWVHLEDQQCLRLEARLALKSDEVSGGDQSLQSGHHCLLQSSSKVDLVLNNTFGSALFKE